MDFAAHRKRKRDAAGTANNTVAGSRKKGDKGTPAPGDLIQSGTKFRPGGPRPGYVYYWRPNAADKVHGGFWVEQQDGPGMPQNDYSGKPTKTGMEPDSLEKSRIQNMQNTIADLKKQLKRQQDDYTKAFDEHLKQDKDTEKSQKAIANAKARDATAAAIAALTRRIQAIMPFSTSSLTDPKLIVSGIQQAWDDELEYAKKMNKSAIKTKEELKKDAEEKAALQRQYDKSLKQLEDLKKAYQGELKKHDADVKTASGMDKSVYETQIAKLEKQAADLRAKYGALLNEQSGGSSTSRYYSKWVNN